ncbi:MAG: hypothetical protein O2931_15075, partial [Planctomycetota bacterium]|nr:hypothetical protein [Planctomycetota bacterium]
SLDILSAAGGLTGSFGSLTLPGLGQGLGWDVDYQASKLVLSVVSGSVLADINGDGSVDSADIGILLDYWGMSKGPADLTHDGFVDGSDFGIVLSHWTGDSSGSVAVPEPTSLVPILAMVCVAVRRRNSAA